MLMARGPYFVKHKSRKDGWTMHPSVKQLYRQAGYVQGYIWWPEPEYRVLLQVFNRFESSHKNQEHHLVRLMSTRRWIKRNIPKLESTFLQSRVPKAGTSKLGPKSPPWKTSLIGFGPGGKIKGTYKWFTLALNNKNPIITLPWNNSF